MNTKALRQKILDLAIHGKLVPQDPNDEPASVLLDRIRAEKERLIQEGKIKRAKKSATSDKSPYGNEEPWELPQGWVWTTLGDFCKSISDGDHQAPIKTTKGIPFLVISDVVKGYIDFSAARYVSQEYYSKITNERRAEIGDILFTVTGSYGVPIKVETRDSFCFQRHIGLIKTISDNNFLYHLLSSRYIKTLCDKVATGTAQKTVGLESLRNFSIPLPPLAEQQRIVEEVERLNSLVDIVEQNQEDLTKTISQAKAKILDLAIHGKLVPQDPSDEPAEALLKRINPKWQPSDNPHYEQMPFGWAECALEDILDYEQPQAYIVESTDYSDEYPTPVLTAGKSFVIGYTNETTGICNNLPVIIFDDFTTDSKYVDFPFKVKSSAMKILHPREGVIPQYVQMFMGITKLVGDTHKRYWISEYSKLRIGLPPLEEQKRIVAKVAQLFELSDNISLELSAI